MSAVHALLRDSIDYAGLFPPAGLGMAEAVANYASYRTGPHAWALGRFVVSAGRLVELEQATERLLPPSNGWRIAALLAFDPARELEAIGEFNCRHAAEGAGEAAEHLLARIPAYLQPYIEIPVFRDPAPLATAVGRAGGRLKVRTGGVTADAFPSAADLARFLRTAAGAGVPFKATAGLHHPLRAEYRLTYEPASACGTMFGFLNLFLATAFVSAGMDDAAVERLLEERDRQALRFDAGGVEWRGRRVDLETLRRTRESGIVSFGSCSFTEPLADLQSLDLL
jgi:hypothetical protein